MSYLIANVVLIAVPVLGLAGVRRRVRKDLADMAEAEANIAAWRAAA